MGLRHLMVRTEFPWRRRQRVPSFGSKKREKASNYCSLEKKCYFSLATLRLIYSVPLPATPRF